MTAHAYTEADAALLACSGLALPKRGALRPLGPRAWSTLRERLGDAGLDPGELVGLPAADLEARLGLSPEWSARLTGLFARHGQLAMELERLARLGIWVVTLGEDGYPARLAERLGGLAPPVLLGLGDRGLLGRDGLAVVGSRDADEAALEVARLAGEEAARQGWTLVSGAARGVDAAAMRGAWEAGGSVVGAPADGLERHLRDATVRAAASEGRVAYVSTQRPDAPFSVGAAMGRNRLVHCLARASLVVRASAGSGGTWAGAVEALERGWVPLHVIDDDTGGGRALVERGARAVPVAALSDLARLADEAPTAAPPAEAEPSVQQTLF
jgi:predicted Rossmann fold nucleotide-binding protein DprA/Smf involved in DNA uptake